MEKRETTLTQAQLMIAERLFNATYAVTIGKREGNPISRAIPMADFPMASWIAIVNYGVQRKFNDKVGGKDKNQTTKLEMIDTMLEAYKNGQVRAASAAAATPLEKAIRSVLRAELKATMEAAAFKAATDADDFDEQLDDLFDGQTEETQAAITAKAEEIIEAERKRKAGIGGLKLTMKLGAK